MLIPSQRLLWALAVVLALGIVAAIVPASGPLWIIGAAALVLVALYDAIRVLRRASPEAQRIVPASLALGVRREVELAFAHDEPRGLLLEVFDHHPEAMQVEGLPRSIVVAPGGTTQMRYGIRPLERGDLRFGRIEVRLHSPLQLWVVRRSLGEAASVRVFPNFSALTKYALFATDNRLSQIGILQRRRRGEGMDFNQLREYRQGDSLRSIDWRATARTAKLVSREYQDERNQQVVFLLDCGRRMAARDGELSHFDHMLNAALLLAYVGLRQGDAVGLLTMGLDTEGSTRYLAPRRSGTAINGILNAVYDLSPTLATTDYYRAAQELAKRVTKRALVVILTNLRDEDSPDLQPALGLLQNRHLVVLASLREQILGDALARPIAGLDDALTHAATATYLARRAAGFSRLERRGVICLDVEPQDLALSLVNRYLDVKRSGRL